MQAVVVAVSWLLTVYFCTGGHPSLQHWQLVRHFVGPLVLLRLVSLLIVTRSRLQWRFASLSNLALTGEAVSLGTIVFLVVASTAGMARTNLSLAALASLEWFITLNLLMGLQLTARTAWSRFLAPRPGPRAARRKVLVIGAGDAGQRIVRSMQEDGQANLTPVGFLDDDPMKWGRLIHGIHVYGSVDLAPAVCDQQVVDQVLIAIPSLTSEGLRGVIRRCAGVQADITMLPRLDQLLGADPTATLIRKVDTVDLLERKPVKVDLESVAGYAAGQCVMVTGAGGSIGSELCRQIVNLKPKSLILLGHGENSLFTIQQELRQDYGYEACAVVADVQDRSRLETVFRRHRPDVVFHAAAHKHVPLMEEHPQEAVKNNVFGTRNVAELSIAYGVHTFVMISTDKAVNPTSVMGASKRVAEMVVQSLAQRIQTARAGRGSDAHWGFDAVPARKAITRFGAVRFGNVLGSRGSVIPTMQRQIEKGGPITITHPDMVRFFMTIPEAVQLVLQAGALGAGGEVFVLDMGQPIRVVDLAENLVRLSGLVPGRDIQIQVTGIRPGEKLYEEILTAEEGTGATHHERIYTSPPTAIDHEALGRTLTRLKHATDTDNSEQVREILRNVVPGYHQPAESTVKEAGSVPSAPPAKTLTGVRKALSTA
jgi:FlaA1/EpsC-like NDP-sugar epimerase